MLEQTVRSQPDSLLCTLLDDPEVNKVTPIFVQGDAKLFRFILQWFRYRKILLPPSVSTQEMRRECAYFQLPDDIAIEREGLVSTLGGIGRELQDCFMRAQNQAHSSKEVYRLATSQLQGALLYRAVLEKLQTPLPKFELNVQERPLNGTEDGMPDLPQAKRRRVGAKGPFSVMCGFQDCGKTSVQQELLDHALKDGWDVSNLQVEERGRLCFNPKLDTKEEPTLAATMSLLSARFAQAKQKTEAAIKAAKAEVKIACQDLVAASIYSECMQKMQLAAKTGTLRVSVDIADLESLQSSSLTKISGPRFVEYRSERTPSYSSLETDCAPRDLAPFQAPTFVADVRQAVETLAAKDGWVCRWSHFRASPADSASLCTRLAVTWAACADESKGSPNNQGSSVSTGGPYNRRG